MQEDQVVRRRVRDDISGLRRGSLKSRFVELSRRRKRRPPEPPNSSDNNNGASRSLLPPVAEGSIQSQDIRTENVLVHGDRSSRSQPSPSGSRQEGTLVRLAEEGSSSIPHSRGVPSPHQTRSQSNRDYSLHIGTSTHHSPQTPSPRPNQLRISPQRVPPITRFNQEQPGHLLNSAIARQFRRIHCQQSNNTLSPWDTSAQILSSNLKLYIKDVFLQLDNNNKGSVAREDFECLCEILQLDSHQAVSRKRNSLEWLSSYHPRPNSPGSPIRLDKLDKVSNKNGVSKIPKSGPSKPPTSFLWTLGPRPFWELWPNAKRRRKRLSLDQFTQSLLEQWSITHGFPLETARNLLQSTQQNISVLPQLSSDKIQAEKIIKSERSLKRNHHVLERITRRLGGSHGENNGINGRSNGIVDPYRVSNGARTNGISNGCNGATNDAENGINCVDNGINNGIHTTSHFTTNINGNKTNKKASRSRLSGCFQRSQNNQLEEYKVFHQKEISTLKSVINQLRDSLQLSDAQNLALQVILKRMERTGHQVSTEEKSQSIIEKSEKQLEKLIDELREMSQTKYPTLSSQNYSSSSSSYTREKSSELVVEPDLGHTQDYLTGIQNELRGIAFKLKQSPFNHKDDLSLTEAFEALVQAQMEIQKLRTNLDTTQSELENSRSSLIQKERKLSEAQSQLSLSASKIDEANYKVQVLRENRKSLLMELKAAKEVLLTSLGNVQDLEIESKKVPKLEARIRELERTASQQGSHGDQDDTGSRLLDESMEGSDEYMSFTRRPSPRISPFLHTGRDITQATPVTSSHPMHVIRLSPRDQRKGLRESQRQSQSETERERYNQDVEQGSRQSFDTSQVLLYTTTDTFQLSLIEQRIREVLAMLRSLNTINIPESELGRLVLEAVEKAWNPVIGEVAVFKFLSLLYQSSREYEKKTADALLTEAIDAVKEDVNQASDSSTSQGGSLPERMDTLRPRRVLDIANEDNWRIDV